MHHFAKYHEMSLIKENNKKKIGLAQTLKQKIKAMHKKITSKLIF